MAKPTLAMKRLARRMAALREVSGMTPQQVEDTGLRDRKSLRALEKGQVVTNWAIVSKLAELYGASPAKVREIESLAKRAATKGWDEKTTALNDFSLFLELEPEATHIKILDPEGVTGILQTEDYIEAIFAADLFLTPEMIPLAVAQRKQRQSNVLARTDPPQIQVIMTEGALLRTVGGPEVHRAQLEHLRVASTQGVDIRVLRNDVGAYSPMNGPFTLLEFHRDDIDDPDTVYLESFDGCRYLEGEIVSKFARLFAELLVKADDLEDYLSNDLRISLA